MSLPRAIGRCAVVAALVAWVFVACAGGPAPIDHFYTVEVAAPSSTSGAALTGTLHVDPLRSDGLIGQRNLLYRQHEGSAEIRQHKYHRWTDPPALALQAALVTYLREAAAAQFVMESNARTRAAYTVTGRIQRFERHLDGGAIVEIDLTLTSVEGAVLVHESYTEKRTGSDVANSATAVGEAVHGIFERFLADLRRSAEASRQP